MKSSRYQAILLIGPTGSGKTPLGDWLQCCGLWKRKCHHFDFGAGLRAAVSGEVGDGFSQAERRYIKDVIDGGALLENETFYLALRILDAFMKRRRVQPDDLLVMNGLPRHTGQAEGLRAVMRFLAVICLQCTAETVLDRLRCNAGGDRTERSDDDVAMVERKLAVFAERTRPLVDLYREQGVPLFLVDVSAQTQPEEIRRMLEIRPLPDPRL